MTVRGDGGLWGGGGGGGWGGGGEKVVTVRRLKGGGGGERGLGMEGHCWSERGGGWE